MVELQNLKSFNVIWTVIDSNFRQISSSEKKIFDSFIDIVANSNTLGECRVLYRGDDLKKMKKRLNYSDKEEEENLIFKLFTMGGLKPKFYFDRATIYPEVVFFDNINTVSEKTFDFLYSRFHSIFYKQNPSNTSKSTILRIRKFREQNEEFVKEFDSLKNGAEFVSKIMSYSQDKKEEIRDYYLYLLHTLGTLGITNISFFVSTTEKIVLAEKFENGMIFYGWAPTPVKEHGLNEDELISTNKLIELSKLPIYHEGFYPEQYETALKGGFFPHYLIGYYDTTRDIFVANYNLFIKENKRIVEFSSQIMLNSFIKTGFFIDQSPFNQYLENSKFRGSVKKSHNNKISDEINE